MGSARFLTKLRSRGAQIVKTALVRKESRVKNKIAIAFFVATCLCSLPAIFAQGMGEYGRTLGGVGSRAGAPVSPAPTLGRQSSGSRSSGGTLEGKVLRLPSQLSVSSIEATLYSRSEDWSDRVAVLIQGQKLFPIAQTFSAGITWFMVKAENGIVGWIKSSDVGQTSKQP